MIIWLASYPRSGNTFLRTTLNSAFGLKSKSMHGDDADIGGEDEFAGIVGHVKGTVSEAEVDALRRDADVHLIKTHHGPSHYMNVDDSVIHIVRDGRDAVVSYYHYLKKVAGNRNINLRDVVIGMAGYGLWSRHARDWENAQFRKRSLFRYEDMVEDSSKLIGSLAAALGREPVSHTVPTFETLKGINAEFFRKGKVGSWAEELNGADEKLFWLHNGSMMLRFGYDSHIPPDMESLVRDPAMTDFFEERSYNGKRDIEQFRRALLRRSSQPVPARPEAATPAGASKANGSAPPPLRMHAARPANDLIRVDRRVLHERADESDVRWYVGQILTEVIRRRDAGSLMRLFLERIPQKHMVAKGKADFGWLAGSVLGSKRSLKIPIVPAPDFDEQAYLERYSDVRRAVAEGRISCGFAHYVHFGRGESRERPTIRS